MNKILHRIYIGSFFLIGIFALVFISVDGFSYYSTSLEERFFHSQHNLLKPSGILGHGYGIIGSLMMVLGVVFYMLRKRVRTFFNIGYLKHWLEFHIFLCTVGPLLILYHTAFKFGGIVAVSFWSMTAVVLSGFEGRFIYVQIPRNISGRELDIKQLEDEREELRHILTSQTGTETRVLEEMNAFSSSRRYKDTTFIMSLFIVLQDFFRIRKFTAQVGKELKTAGLHSVQRKKILKSVKQQLILTRRIGLLRTMQKLFRYWHIVHLPFAIIMFIIMVVHIVITILFGYRWIF